MFIGGAAGSSDAVEHSGDEIAHGGLVVGSRLSGHTVGDYRAHGHGSMSHEQSETLEGRRLHLVVCHRLPFVAECLDTAVEVGVGQRQSQFAALRSVESDS